MLARLFHTVPTLRLVPGLPPLFDALLLSHTALFHKDRLLALHQIEQVVLSWPGVTTRIHRFGGTEFCLGRREIGHFHGNGLLDIPLTKALREQVVRNGRAQPHHIFPRSTWISFYVFGPADVSYAVNLLQLNYDRWHKPDSEKV